MDSDMKWVGILLLVFMVVPLLGIGWNDYQRSQCQLEAIKVAMPADDIAKVCGK
jgi:hypothetical protein